MQHRKTADRSSKLANNFITHSLFALIIASSLLFAACTSTPTTPSPTPTAPTAIPTANKSLIASIEKVDAYAVRLTLNRPDAVFLQKLAFPAFGPQSPANLIKYNGGGDLMRNLVGAGPFRLVERV